MGGEHHRYYKHTKFHQNPRGDPKFLVDLTRNDPKAKQSLQLLSKWSRQPSETLGWDVWALIRYYKTVMVQAHKVPSNRWVRGNNWGSKCQSQAHTYTHKLQCRTPRKNSKSKPAARFNNTVQPTCCFKCFSAVAPLVGSQRDDSIT